MIRTPADTSEDSRAHAEPCPCAPAGARHDDQLRGRLPVGPRLPAGAGADGVLDGVARDRRPAGLPGGHARQRLRAGRRGRARLGGLPLPRDVGQRGSERRPGHLPGPGLRLQPCSARAGGHELRRHPGLQPGRDPLRHDLRHRPRGPPRLLHRARSAAAAARPPAQRGPQPRRPRRVPGPSPRADPAGVGDRRAHRVAQPALVAARLPGRAGAPPPPGRPREHRDDRPRRPQAGQRPGRSRRRRRHAPPGGRGRTGVIAPDRPGGEARRGRVRGPVPPDHGVAGLRLRRPDPLRAGRGRPVGRHRRRHAGARGDHRRHRGPARTPRCTPTSAAARPDGSSRQAGRNGPRAARGPPARRAPRASGARRRPAAP